MIMSLNDISGRMVDRISQTKSSEHARAPRPPALLLVILLTSLCALLAGTVQLSLEKHLVGRFAAIAIVLLIVLASTFVLAKRAR